MKNVGLLVMAYGTASGPEDVQRYYTDIRGGRPPAPEALADLVRRYEAIGNTFPLDRVTRDQAAGLERELNVGADDTRFRSYVGYKHSPPFVGDVVRQLAAEGIDRALGIVMAPHYSQMSIGSYFERAMSGQPEGLTLDFIESWHDHPAFLDVLAARVSEAMEPLSADERSHALVVFTAHSLPARILETGDPYPDQLQATAEAVADRLGLHRITVAWQSAGRTGEPWLGPDLGAVIEKAAKANHSAVVVCPCGFVADHLEILYDIDIEAKETAERADLRLVRTASMNATPEFVKALAAVVRDHLAVRT
ncbi:MAG: ferrochelatase [Actinomycetota bacterium]